jgi:hypothetical protein
MVNSNYAAEKIVLMAIRNKRKVIKLSLSSAVPEKYTDYIVKAAGKGYWVVLENFHFLSKRQSLLLIKKLDKVLTAKKTKKHFKVWITFQVLTENYSIQTFLTSSNSYLETFFHSCFKVFINKPENMKQKLINYYKLETNEYLLSLEEEHIDLNQDKQHMLK